MSLIDGIRHRIHVLFRREAYMREVERELRFHAELDALATSADVATVADAELSARRRLGNVTYYREETRHMTLLYWLDRLHQDATYAVRGLRRSPGFTITVVVTLALGFGVNAAMYSMLDQVFRRDPAGVVNPGQVRRVYEDLASTNRSDGRSASPNFTYPHYRALATAAAPLQMAAFSNPDSVSFVDDTRRIAARASRVAGHYFNILGIRPVLGRFFLGDEDRVESPTPVAVISTAFWHREFGGDGKILGRTVTVNHRPVTIVGVAAGDFGGVDLDAVDLWLPANMSPSSNSQTPWYESYPTTFQVLTRVLTPGDEARLLAVAPAAMQSVHIRYLSYDSTARVVTGSIIGAGGPVQPAQEVLVAKKISWIALIVLLIASANVTNLLLLRAAGRRREIAVRRALGVSHARLCGQLATEAVLLAILGAAAALVVAFWTGNALRGLMLPRVHWASGPVDMHTLLFMLGVSLAIGLCAGLVPAVYAMRPDLTNTLKAGMRGGSYRRSALRSGLVVAQTSLCVMLLVGAGLFARSLNNIRSIDVGYDVDDVTTFSPSFIASGARDAERAAALPQIAARLERVHGVVAAADASAGPMQGWSFTPLFLPDRDSVPKLPGDGTPSSNGVSPEYFRATGLAILSGRTFTSADYTAGSRSIIVSERMARTYWPGTTAIGKCLIAGERSSPCSTVVGVAADAHRRKILEAPIMQYYVPASPNNGIAFTAPKVLVVRTEPGQRSAVVHEVERLFSELVPGLDGLAIARMSDVLEPELRPWRLGTSLFIAFGLLALAVAGIGIYSVVAYSVAQRTHEMGVRMALGAQTADILDAVLSESARVLLSGILLGLAGALALGRFVASLLFGITPSDPSILIGASVTLLTLALVACVVPGWRAARIDPSTALRTE